LALGFLATKARPDVLTLSLPADLAAGMVDALGQLRASAAPARRAPLDDLARDLAAAESAGEPLELTARRDLLVELLAVAIDDAADRLGQHGTRLVRGEASAAELRAGVAELSGLLDLLETANAG
jgi:hypothetical protein